MNKVLLTTVSLFTCLWVCAQQFDYSLNKSWDDKPTLHQIKKPYDSASAAGILDERRFEYYNEKDNIFINEYNHLIVKLTNDNGIERFNKVYIPIYENATIENIKARTILPNGKVIVLDTNTIKEITDDGQQYKLFAFEGLEPGCEIEYAYSVKRGLSLFGSEVFQRISMPYLHARFTLITPAYLKFDAKGYNGFNVSADSVIGEQRVIAGYSDDLNEIDDEKYAQPQPYLQRVEYKLSYNLNKSESVRLYTWKEYAKKVYEYYITRTPKEEKAIEAFAPKINLKQSDSDAQKIFAIEDYVKNNISIDKDAIGENAGNIESIIKNKTANVDGASRLFAGIFDKLGINYEIVFPGTRIGYTIDEELENWNRANIIIFYFPSTGKFMAPSSIELRYPYIPYEFTETRGLFLKGTTIGDYRTAIGTFKNIPIEPFDQHAHNLEADVRFSEKLDTAIIQLSQIYRGYGAAGYRPLYHFLTPDKQNEANKEIIKAFLGSDDISNIKVENASFLNYFDNKPLIISAQVKSADMLERAGNKILFKVGAVIGPQEQMYQEKPRQLPAELPYPHVLNRKIVVHIPDGYTIKNADDINLSVVHKENDVITMGFVSSYTQNDNTLTITINETYREIKYPLSQFEEFKKVINASADFNKVVLLLEKK